MTLGAYHGRLTVSPAFTSVTRFIQRVVNLAGVHKLKTLPGSPPRRRAQTWCSFFIAPCASLFIASWNSGLRTSE